MRLKKTPAGDRPKKLKLKKKVIKAASTKWNFIKFFPGLVGGDCIAVDPYYILHSAKKINYNLPLVSLARKTNEDMEKYIYDSIINILITRNIQKIAFFVLTL